MKRPKIKKALVFLVLAPLAFVTLLLIEALLALSGGTEPFKNPSRQPRRLGTHGPALVYVVMGDSTAAGQGGAYERGIALQTAAYLSQSRRVTLTNLSVSGATTDDILRSQLPAALRLKPDIVLLSVGANDVTRLTSGTTLKRSLARIVDRLRESRCDTRIVLTGAPAMGTVRRFAQPLRWVAGLRSSRVNRVFASLIAERQLVWARIAQETGPLFARDATLFAPDRFHPNERGYAAWVPVINAALDEALNQQPISSC